MNSIRASLVAMLVATFTLVSFLASLNSYQSSMIAAETLLDGRLQHASDVLQIVGRIDSADMLIQQQNEDFAFQVWRDDNILLQSRGSPQSVINDLVPGFRYANFAGYRWRTLTSYSSDGHWFIVAERADLRHMLAEKLVLESILPLLLWLPIAAILTWVLVGWGLRPLRDLSRQINRRRSDDLQSIEYFNAPTELLPLISSTNSLLARLSASFEREKHFAAHAAHELRTPLSVLKVHLHNLAQELPSGHSGLAHADRGVDRMHHLVEQILDLNRTNPDVIQANFDELDLHALAQRVTAAAWPAFSQKDQTLSLSGDSVIMTGDEVMLETLLQNLLDNAGKYTPGGGEVIVFVGRVANCARIQVEDTGPGVAVDERPRVFERFYRASGTREGTETGSGLGMAIVQHIVQLHGASISLGDSSLGSGLSVTVDFPTSSPVATAL